MSKKLVLNENQLIKLINESIKKVLSESFKSKKLAKFAKKHGGLVNGKWSSNVNDLYNMTDEEFEEYIPTDQVQHYKRFGFGGYDQRGFSNYNFQPIEFADGTFLVKNIDTSHGADFPKSTDNQIALRKKRNERYQSRQNDGFDEYQYENPYLHDIINTEFTPRGNWGYNGDSKLEKQNLNPRAIRSKHLNQKYSNFGEWGKAHDELNNGKFKESNDDENSLVNKTRKASKINKNKKNK